MKNTYFLSLQIPPVFKSTFLDNFVRELESIGIENKQDLKKTGLIETTYQNERYILSLEQYVHFPSVFKIRTNISCTTEKRGGLITLIWRILNWNYGIEYRNMEFFTEEAFTLIRERFHLRFINFKKLHEIIDTIQPVELLEFEEYSNGQTIIKKATVDSENSLDEEIWIRIAKSLDYDGWDTVNREFIPLTVEEYTKEINDFANSWNIEHNQYLMNYDDTISILRLSKTWDSNEYLIKTSSVVKYLSTNVWTG